MTKAILFDIDGVLLDSFETNLKFFQDLLTKAGHQPPTRETLRPLFHLPMLDTIKALAPRASAPEVQRIWEMGRDRVVEYDHTLLTMPEGIDEVLDELHKNYVLGIVTSRVKSGIFKVPQLAKFKSHFQATAAYEDTENHKPHPEPLLYGAKELGVKPEECIYIGDAQSDITAGHAAGMKVIIYNKTPLEQADACTSDFKKLPGLIETLK